MAVFEKKVHRKVYLDDTQVLKCMFENAQNIQGHTEYVIRVQRGPGPEKCWRVCKRYNDFVCLHNALQASGLALPLPPKRLIGNMDREFVAERRISLENYINCILMNPILASSLPVKKFLDPDNYSTPFHELALQHVSMALRSEMNYEVVRPVPDMGWRLRKHHFLVRDRSRPAQELLLSWVEHGPDKYLDDKDLQAAFKALRHLQHPFIQTIELLSCNEVGGFVARRLSVAGSVRDVLCCTTPKLPFLKKYGNPRQHRPFPAPELALLGSQILQALGFLHDKGLPFGHLHTGNIAVESGRVKLLDVENGVLGLPSYYRPYFVQHKKIQTLEAIDVYSFGHVLFEMAFGRPLHESVCDDIPAGCPSMLDSVLEAVLSSKACRSGMPTVAALLAHPFFRSQDTAPERPQFKLAPLTRDALRGAWQRTEARLHEEQRMVRQQKRLVKVQQLLSSEDEMKKRKQKLRQEQKERHLQLQQQDAQMNGTSPERSDSPNSTSTATSAGTVTPPADVFFFLHAIHVRNNFPGDCKTMDLT
ncbi:PX domain-containing protein kinase-like protein isoform X2 [Bacillus rossius redtenbacheri]|uniref:PX domain-containing protein kinase-like protein isoform X2 n=1 Tax=Bacillus rossius redtenbacheri TaxID=93214 RepID=UPI002FDEEC70